MIWTPVEQEAPRWAQEVLVENKDGDHFVCHYFPDNPCPWIVELVVEQADGRVYAFFTSLKNEDIAAWANIEER